MVSKSAKRTTKAAAKPKLIKMRPPGQNPLLEDWTTPFEMPPFDRIELEHFVPAFDKGFAANRKEIAAIADNPRTRRRSPTPSRRWSARAIARSRRPPCSSTWPAPTPTTEIQAIERAMAPRFAKHGMRIYQDATLFARVDALFKKRKKLGLTRGAGSACWSATTAPSSSPAPGSSQRPRSGWRRLPQRMSVLGTHFSQNLLADEQAFVLVLDGEADLAGLPEAVRAAAAQTANERGHKGKHAITLSRSSIEPFLQYSARRDLREKAFNAWIMRGANGGKTDNRKIVAEILGLRAERARLLGFKTAADSALEFSMAKTPAAVRKLLMEVWGPARKRAAEERDQLQKAVQAEGGNFKLAALGLALLRREGAQGQVRRRRRRRSSPTCSSTASSPPPSTWRASCSA